MARAGQVLFIEDLLDKLGLDVAELPDEYQPRGGDFATLKPLEASDLIEWLQAREKGRDE